MWQKEVGLFKNTVPWQQAVCGGILNRLGVGSARGRLQRLWGTL